MSKIGRNDPCHCGSGKKYKKCCLSKDEERILEKMKETAVVDDGEPWEDNEEEPGWFTLDDKEEAVEEEEAEFEEVENDEVYDDTDVENDTPHDKETDKDIFSEKSPYPAISKEEEEIVDEWWDEYETIEHDPDKVSRHLQQFMDKYSPEMVENIGMEYEVLFELGADYYRAGRHEEYIQLLKEMRLKYPGVYKRSAGFYDEDIIAWLIANKQDGEIYNYLDYFEKYPVDYVDEMFRVIKLMQANDNIQPLLTLVKNVHRTVTTSPKIINGQEIIFPLMTNIMSGYLRPGFTEEDLLQMLKELSAEFGDNKFEDINFWKKRFDQIFRPFTKWDENITPKKMKMEEKYLAISFNYMRYLHEHKNISWECAHYYSQLLQSYLFKYLDLSKNKPKSIFNFKMSMMDKIVGQLSSGFIISNFVKAVAILNSAWYFLEYLQLCGNVDEEKKKIMQANCTSLYYEIYKPWRKQSIEALCFSKFPFWD